MGALLESGMVGNIGLKHLKVIKEDTLNKWDGLGFLDGLKGHVKENIAQLYENQATNLINEATTAGDSGSFETVVFPIIRRVFSKLLANDIVSVQAMNLPIGKLFYFVPKITPRTVVAGVNTGAGGGTGSHGAPMGSTGNPANANPVSGATGNLYDDYYAQNSPQQMTDGTYDYSRGKYTVITAATLEQTWNGNQLVSGVGTVVANDGTCPRGVIIALSGFSSTGSGSLTGPDGNEQDTEDFLSSLQLTTQQTLGCCTTDHTIISSSTKNSIAATTLVGYGTQTVVPYRLVTQKYGYGIVDKSDVCDSTGAVYLEVDLSCPACITCSSTDGYIGMSGGTGAAFAFDASWRRYATLEFEEDMGEVSFDLQGVTVSVTERKLRASWSPELAQDVSAFHNIDAEAELTALLSEEVAAEIDREILRDLRKGAAWDLRWDYNGWKRFSAGQAPYTQKDWNQTLITAVNQISAQIHKSTLRGGANWIVCSSEVSAIFDDLEYFHVSNAAADQDQYNMGIEKIGTLAGRFTVYRDPYFPANQVLIGHKGTSLLDTGYVYAPYVPLQLTPTMYNPFNFTPIKGIMTRYAKKMVNNRFYGRITVDGVRTFDVRELR